MNMLNFCVYKSLIEKVIYVWATMWCITFIAFYLFIYFLTPGTLEIPFNYTIERHGIVYTKLYSLIITFGVMGNYSHLWFIKLLSLLMYKIA